MAVLSYDIGRKCWINIVRLSLQLNLVCNWNIFVKKLLIFFTFTKFATQWRAAKLCDSEGPWGDYNFAK